MEIPLKPETGPESKTLGITNLWSEWEQWENENGAIRIS